MARGDPPDDPRGEDKEVSGERYRMRFYPGSLGRDIEFVLSARSGTLRFELEPHRERFRIPVELTIDYKGTNADPQSSNYDGTVPLLYYYNEYTLVWETVPGIIDTGDCKYKARLPHFSNYVLGGRAGW